jgi:hypothetical protein
MENGGRRCRCRKGCSPKVSKITPSHCNYSPPTPNLLGSSCRGPSKPTVADNQSPPILGPWVFLFWTSQEHLRRPGNAVKHLFRVYWRDWHKPITLKLNIYHFEPPNFGGPPNN